MRHRAMTLTQPVPIRPTPQVFHRYRPDEMSGSLPAILYKVLPRRFAHRLIAQGEMMWSTLTYFHNVEEAQRGDVWEGTRGYFPVRGLDVNRIERAGRPDHTAFTLQDCGMVSRAAQSNHIFIYSMTLDRALAIGDPSDRACLEIFDPAEFVRRVRECLKRTRKGRVDTLIHHTVGYWSPANPPEEVWALPDKLTMHKHEDFKDQREYRLAFGTRANVFDFEHVECFVVGKDVQWPRLSLDPQVHRMKLRAGPLETCCRLG
jgi:hypothetical protein